MKTECWDKVVVPLRKVWSKVSKKLRLRKTGHVKLRQEIRTCEYEDVHILWHMLKRNETDLTRSKRGPSWGFVQWAKHTPLLCRGG
ncbi:hypothetical protein CDL12_05185 [Handroanthus impetiginosus]|uniref:Uncharacterized protein n=1 Tax=Handroanthus impetiginosus TaxID=429701 RepID=A0A2G9HX59_9LAMI|nr:hypothetical protein CDL12_05185 [Handroanthus impetiginosus]